MSDDFFALFEHMDNTMKEKTQEVRLQGSAFVPPPVPLAGPEPAVEQPFSLFGDNQLGGPSKAVRTAHIAPEPAAEESNAELIGKHVAIKEMPYDLNRKQKNYADIAAKQVYIAGGIPTAQDVYDLWPQGLLKNGVSPKVTDPEEISRIVRAGFRPMINDLVAYLESSEHAERMSELGIVVNTEDTGLTSEQIGLLTILSNYADGKDLRGKLRAAGVPWAKYQAWLSQPVFARYYNQIGGEALKTSMPIAKQQIASKIAAGDMSAIKLGMEMTGEFDPKGQKQVDAQALLRIVLEAIEEEVKDPVILQRIGAKMAIRSQKEIGGS